MRRAGSTLQTQLVSALLGGIPAEVSSHSGIVRLLSGDLNYGKPVIKKFHRYVPELRPLLETRQALAFYVFRDIREVVASISRMYSIPAFSFIHGGLESLVEEYRDWTALPGVYVARYEDMVSDTVREVQRLGEHMGRSVSRTEAEQIARQFSIEEQRTRIRYAFEMSGEIRGSEKDPYDAQSLLHRNHIQSDGISGDGSPLRPVEVAAIEWLARDWMRETGYEPRFSVFTQWLSFQYFMLKSWLHNLKLKCVRALQRSASDEGS